MRVYTAIFFVFWFGGNIYRYVNIYITSLTGRVADVLVLLTPMMNRARAGVLRCKGTNLILSDCTSFGLRSRSYFYGFLKHGSRLSLLSKATAQQVGVDLCVGVHACVSGRRFGHGKYNPAGIESELLDNAVLTDVHACVRVGRARGASSIPPSSPPPLTRTCEALQLYFHDDVM